MATVAENNLNELALSIGNSEKIPISQTIEKQVFKSKIAKVEIEQKGDVKTVIRIEGKFANEQREWLPFIIRLYFYAGVENVKIVQTLIYDGEAERILSKVWVGNLTCRCVSKC